ncbi:MAG: hypothetical protein ACTHLN_02955 [Tepidisphaeraceae bacterium]
MTKKAAIFRDTKHMSGVWVDGRLRWDRLLFVDFALCLLSMVGGVIVSDPAAPNAFAMIILGAMFWVSGAGLLVITVAWAIQVVRGRTS